MDYWEGQRVLFVCCERNKDQPDQGPWGNVFWAVSIEVATN